ncbi:hypothetical protein KW850_10315 [Bacillus sp. sid0103]|uniref:hypothetical protein n=1 Tax=Bacillus sp. sid0103 TaxID=2856337 RepID=UPI001C446392|nr:hypothetical protein [Bacillus sp. sid0103]MBV7505649.1 hypothetical protein [Bacillus sp. sid0103]
MTDYKQIIEQLKQQNMNPNTSESQREANSFRVKWLEMLHKEKPAPTKIVFYDAVQQRLAHGYSITPNKLLHD